MQFLTVMHTGNTHIYIYTCTNQTQTYAHTHVHTQRCSVQDHSRVIVELENVYVMLCH